jgi:hypothetical protein
MEALPQFLEDLRQHGLDRGHTLGLLNVLIGRRVALADGTVVCSGLTWRELAAWLKKVRWDKDAVKELDLEPKDLPPRDRQQYWYAAIARAGVDSAKASQAGDELAAQLRKAGYVVTDAPGTK